MLNESKFILIFICLLIFAQGQSFAQQRDCAYAPGKISLDVPDGCFDFPLEVFGAYISFEKRSDNLKIDSLIYSYFKPNSRVIEREKVLSTASALKTFPRLNDKLKLNFSKEILGLFRKYSVKFIKRNFKTFSPQDTIPHPVRGRNGTEKLITRSNLNKYLIIEFDPSFDAKKVADDFKRLEDVLDARPDYYIIPHEGPNDFAYQGSYQFYMDPDFMNFENGWDIIKGEDADIIPIIMGIIDEDFSNADVLTDLAQNLNPNGPGAFVGTGSGHGTEVSSLVCAVTNNSHLIAGGSWNSPFIPFIASTTSEVVDALALIDAFYSDTLNNDMFVINMSFGADDTPALQNICNHLYDDHDALLVAAVGDDGTSIPSYPASYSSVIGVGASNSSDDGLYVFSNWGNDVEFIATGESVYTLDADDSDHFEANWGTSYAAPFVSSLITLILSTKDGWFTSSAAIRNAIQVSAKTISANGKTFYRINAYETLKKIFSRRITSDITSFTTWCCDDYVLIENPNDPPTRVIYEVDGVDLYIDDGAVVVVEENVWLKAVNGGRIICQSGAKIILEPSAELICDPGGFLTDNGADVRFLGQGACLATNGGTLTFSQNVNRTVDNEGLIAANNNGIIELKDNARLIFKAGTDFTADQGSTFKMGKNARIDMYGKMLAQGTAANPITFTSDQTNPTSAEYWDGIRFYDSADDASIIEYATIEYARLGLWLNSASPTIRHNTLRNGHLYNLRLDYSTALIEDNIIENSNLISGVYARYSDATFDNNTIWLSSHHQQREFRSNIFISL